MNNKFKSLDYQTLSAAAILMSLVMIVIIGLLFAVENHFGKDVEADGAEQHRYTGKSPIQKTASQETKRAARYKRRKKLFENIRISIATVIAAFFAILFLMPIVLTITNSFMSSRRYQRIMVRYLPRMIRAARSIFPKK